MCSFSSVWGSRTFWGAHNRTGSQYNISTVLSAYISGVNCVAACFAGCVWKRCPRFKMSYVSLAAAFCVLFSVTLQFAQGAPLSEFRTGIATNYG